MTSQRMRRKWPRGLLAPGLRPPRNHVSRVRRRQHLERRKGQIEAQLASINARDQVVRRKRETRANIVIGAVIRSHAAFHPAFVPTLLAILSVALRRQADRELLASILGLPQLIEVDATAAQPNQVGGNEIPKASSVMEPQRSRIAQSASEITARL
jgi:hypothetical protein